MNRIYIYVLALISTVLISSSVTAQNAADAYRFSQSFYEGTARSVGMGNAFTALGGDMGAIAINPASSGVFRYSEFSLTPSLTIGGNDVNYLSSGVSDQKTRFGISNLGYVGTYNTGRKNSGLINLNVSVLLNKSNDFTSRMSAFGNATADDGSWLSGLAMGTGGIHSSYLDMTDDYDPFMENLPWRSILAWNTSLLDPLEGANNEYIAATENLDGDIIYNGGNLSQNFSRETVGSVTDYILNIGGNISNKLFFGVNIGMQNVWYKTTESYSERAMNSQDFQTGFESFRHNYTLLTSGTGFNLKAGLIYLPVAGLRLGASISTPTWLYLTDEWNESMSSSFNDGYSQNISSPLGVYDYRLNTPFRYSLGAAYTFGNFAVLSLDYEGVDYSRMSYKEYGFDAENSDIMLNYTNSNIFRVGAEFNLSPSLALRGGYQNYSNGNVDDKQNKVMPIQVGSLGIGYAAKSGFYIDFAYQQLLNQGSTSFTLYDGIDGAFQSPVGTMESSNYKILLTIGSKF